MLSKLKLGEFFTTRPAMHEGHPSGGNERTSDSSSKPYGEIKISTKSKYVSEYINYYSCNFGL